MRLLKTSIVVLASVFALSSVQAATFVSPGTKSAGDSVIELVKKKKKGKKKASSKGGKCGTFMYWKKGKCEDARAKK